MLILPSIIPYPINDSIWLTNGSFIIGAGHHLCLFGPTEPSKSLFEYAARQNGPLEDYHPQMLLQCLLWGKRGRKFVKKHHLIIQKGKVELVKEIIENLAHDVRNYEKEGSTWHWTPLPVEKFYESDGISPMVWVFFLELDHTQITLTAKRRHIEKYLHFIIQWERRTGHVRSFC